MDMGMGGSTDAGMMGGVSACTDGITVKKGDVISAEAFYDTEKHPLYVFTSSDAHETDETRREHPSGGMSEAMALEVFILGRQMK
jgi:hypothetical protein